MRPAALPLTIACLLLTACSQPTRYTAPPPIATTSLPPRPAPDTTNTPQPEPSTDTTHATLPAIQLTYLASAILPAKIDPFGEVGGLSALAWDGTRFFTLSDRTPDTMVYELAISLSRLHDDYSLKPSILREVHLDHPAKDAEALAISPSGAWFIAYESPATIARLAFDPHAFTLPEEVVRTVRPNLAFESVALRPHPVFEAPTELWAITELAISQDGPAPTSSEGTLCRALVWNPYTGELLDQFTYRTEPMPSTLPIGPSHHSLSEIAALPDGRFLALERSLTLPAGYTARIFLLDASSQPDPDAPFPVLRKELLYDFADSPLRNIGNLEGMTIGPTIAELTGDPFEQGRLLLLIADDNFGRDIQSGSRVIALRLIEVNQ